MLLQGKDKIKEQRALLVEQSVKMEMESLLNESKRELLQMKGRMQSMVDFGNETTYSLKIVADNFDSAQWSKEILNLTVKIELAERELKIKEAKYNELFSEDVQPTEGTV